MATLQDAVSAVSGVTWLSTAPVDPLPGHSWEGEDGGLRVVTLVPGVQGSLSAAAVTAALKAVPLYSQATPVVVAERIGGRNASVSVWAPTDVVDGGAP